MDFAARSLFLDSEKDVEPGAQRMAAEKPEQLASATISSKHAPRKHIRLVKQLIHEIAKRRLEPGDRLGTESEIVEQHGLSRATVRQALAILEREGFILRRQRRGTLIKKIVDIGDILRQLRGTALLLIPAEQDLNPEVDFASFTILQSVVLELGKAGFAVQVLGMGGDISTDRKLLQRAIHRQDVEVVCSYSLDTTAFSDVLRGLPVVTVGTSDPTAGQWVGLNMQEIAHDLTKYLLDHRHRNIALFCGSWVSNEAFAEFATGYRRAFEESGLESRRDRLFLAFEGESLSEMAGAILKSQRPTAVVAEEWRVCNAVIAAAQQLGMRIPENLSIVACGQNAARIETPVPITSYVPNNAGIGREVAKLLAVPTNDASKKQLRIWIRGKIVEARSVKDLDS